MKTVKVFFKDGSSDLKDCWNLDEICLDNVIDILIIRDESKKVA